MPSTRISESVRLELGGKAWLAGQWSFVEPRLDFAVVFVHGFCSVRFGEKSEALEEACARRGWTFATFDFRCHGESSGVMNELRGSALLDDLKAVQNFLDGKGIRRLFLVGSSMGGWASAWFSVKNPGLVAGCAFIAPGFHFLTARWERLSPEEREAWKREGVLRFQNQWVETELSYDFYSESNRFAVETLMREYRTPTIIFQGMQDDVAPYERTVAFVAQSANPDFELVLYKNGDHRLVDRRYEMAELSCRFFGKVLKEYLSLLPSRPAASSSTLV